jgi:GT2 family glycosyltransferase
MSGQGLPSFTIVIPTFARPRQLEACLEALASMEYPRDRFEVVVVDDGSPESPEAVVAQFAGRLDLTLRRQANAGAAAARNHGAQQARGPYLAFTDDDCAPAPGWLSALASALAHWPDRAVGGRTVNALPNNPYATASQLLISYLYEYYNSGPGGARFFTSNNLAVPAEQFAHLGGFDAHYPRAGAEDRDFCDRWLTWGGQMAYAPEAVVYHAHRLTLRSYWRQHVNYGRGAYHLHRTRALRRQARIRIEPASFYLRLVGYPFRGQPGQRAPVLAALLALSQAANALGFFWERIGHSRAEQKPA